MHMLFTHIVDLTACCNLGLLLSYCVTPWIQIYIGTEFRKNSVAVQHVTFTVCVLCKTHKGPMGCTLTLPGRSSSLPAATKVSTSQTMPPATGSPLATDSTVARPCTLSISHHICHTKMAYYIMLGKQQLVNRAHTHKSVKSILHCACAAALPTCQFCYRTKQRYAAQAKPTGFG